MKKEFPFTAFDTKESVVLLYKNKLDQHLTTIHSIGFQVENWIQYRDLL